MQTEGLRHPNPLLSFYAVPACFQEHHTRTFQHPSYTHSVCKCWASPTPTLARLKPVQDRFKQHLASKTEPIWTVSAPNAFFLFANGGGGCASPQGPWLSFYALQACFQEHRTINYLFQAHRWFLLGIPDDFRRRTSPANCNSPIASKLLFHNSLLQMNTPQMGFPQELAAKEDATGGHSVMACCKSNSTDPVAKPSEKHLLGKPS